MASLPGTIYSTYAQTEALKAQSEIQKAQTEMNKEIAEYNAEEAIARGKDDENQFRKQIKKVIGSQRAAIGASGVEISSGSALEVQEDAAAIGEADALTIRQNARMEAMGYKMSALQTGVQGQIGQATNRAQQSSTLLAGGINAGAAIGAFAIGGGFGGGSSALKIPSGGGSGVGGGAGIGASSNRNFIHKG